MKLLREINEAVKIEEINSGFLKHPKSVEKARQVANGEDSVILNNGKEYRAVKRVNGTQLERDMVVIGRYNSYNQGVDIVRILGVTGDDKAYGEGGVKFRSVKEALHHYNVKSLAELEKLQNQNEYGHCSYLYVEDMEDTAHEHKRGAWYYLSGGRWCRGSGAEKLSFAMMEQI